MFTQNKCPLYEIWKGEGKLLFHNCQCDQPQDISNFLYFSLYNFLFFGLYAVPFGEGVDTFLDAFRVDVTLADQTLSGLDHGFDPVQVQLHRGGEVLVFLDGGFNCFHSGGQLHMSKGWLLKNGHGIQWGN